MSTRRHLSRGSTLVGALLALTFVAVTLAILLQGYGQGRRLVAAQQRRAVALALCQQRLELLRAGGYAGLPSGDRVLPAPGLAGGELRLTMAPGPVPESRAVTVAAVWPAEERAPAGRLELATIFSARGLAR